MQKPTSALNFQIIEYLMRQSQVQDLLDARDQDSGTLGVETTCRFSRRIPGGSSRSEYIVDFVYDVPSPPREKVDDISVTVEVREGNPPSFEIRDIRKY